MLTKLQDKNPIVLKDQKISVSQYFLFFGVPALILLAVGIFYAL